MNEQDISGAAHGVADDMQAKSDQAQALIADVADKISAGLEKAGEDASSAVNRLGDAAADSYDRVQVGAHKASQAIEPFMRERPYAALAISAALGMVIGLLSANRGARIVYARPPH